VKKARPNSFQSSCSFKEVDEAGPARQAKRSRPKGKVLVIEDSLMLLNFVEEMLHGANYDVTTAPTAAEGLRIAKSANPDLILLDYILPDMKGDAVSHKLLKDPATKDIPVVYVSGFGGDLEPDRSDTPNVIGFLNKPFTSDLLIETVETHMPKSPDEPEPAETKMPPNEETPESQPAPWSSLPTAQENVGAEDLSDESATSGAYFCGDTSFFPLNWALQTIAKEKLTGVLRSFWDQDPVDLITEDGKIVLATTRNPDLYCPETPITLANLDADRLAAARNQQLENGCPPFLTLAQESVILEEPAVQLVQHHGQKLFAQLWTAPRVRFVFQRRELPSYANGVATDPDIDNWALATLRFIQQPELGPRGNYDLASIPAYTRDGFSRVQALRLTVAEAQFASQFNGVRSIQQIAKNLRLDLKFARLTLFRFLALEIVECWPPSTAATAERKGVFQRLARSIGVGR